MSYSIRVSKAAAMRLGWMALLICGWCFPGAGAERADSTVKVMTRNMDAGTDLKLVLAATDETSFALAVAATLEEVKESGIPERAARLADEIGRQRPDLIGLQEATLWRTGPFSLTPTGAGDVLYDQLGLLQAELAKRKLHYAVIVAQTLLDIEVPVPTESLNLRMTDRNVILARSDLRPSDLHIHHVQAHTFENVLTVPVLGGLTVPEGWESADVVIHGRRLRFVNTHLEATMPEVPDTVLLQLAQAQEILDALEHSEIPVVLLGDFNANAEPGLEHTGSVELILQAGFTDAWKALHPENPGYTWPLFGEDQLRGVPLEPNERIDLVFTRGLEATSVQRTGVGAEPASDHAGVVARVELVRMQCDRETASRTCRALRAE